jgi:hypothetical protein
MHVKKEFFNGRRISPIRSTIVVIFSVSLTLSQR